MASTVASHREGPGFMHNIVGWPIFASMPNAGLISLLFYVPNANVTFGLIFPDFNVSVCEISTSTLIQ